MELVYISDGTTQKSLFVTDNFTSRRTTGNNLYDPESLLTGAEIERGLDYSTPRIWSSYEVYKDACEGKFTPEVIAEIAPRTNLNEYFGSSLIKAA